jgi:hypothetical protein
MLHNLDYQQVKKLIKKITFSLLGVILFLALLHFIWGEEYIVDHYYYFNLDDELNLPTWFSGILFFLFGCAGYATFLVERKINAGQKEPVFKSSFLWVGICLMGFFLSLDEITSLHEHLFLWEYDYLDETFNLSDDLYDYWGVMFAPAIVLMLGYMITFFVNRFNYSKVALRLVYSGIGIWLVALFIEGLRESFYDASYEAYDLSVIFEESFESTGTLLLFSALLFYIADIGLNFTRERAKHFKLGVKILSMRTLFALASLLVIIVILAWIVYLFGEDVLYFY